ncbi:Josephin-like protein [Acorus calamus]|uniref:ubiquitinyl hydrolase 1 n=1 Tax=Acorus calamus TaxID=4465 RepID=A0AAV9EGU7_ACOCL|nr:Josephin-like protein [Acorus calamus]
MEEKKFNREEEQKDISIYHEKQRLQFCLLHALNNLLQERDSFTRSELDAIAEKLVRDDPERPNWAAKPLSLVFTPHHNAITGNYDVNVLIAALESRGKTVSWHDRRGGAASIFGAENLLGVVVNAPVRRFGGLWRGRHWIALRRIGLLWYNLDSDLKEPAPFDDADALIGFLDSVIGRGGEVLIVSNGNGADVEAAAEAEAVH